MIKLTNDELLALDLKKYNGGIDPYPEGDTSLSNAFKRGIEYYRYTVTHKTGFVGGRVLDLLCGFGRWSIFLAEQNESVVGIDRLKDCTNLARNMCNDLGLINTEFLTGEASITKKFPDNEFDYVWMYSALQYVNRKEVLSEIQRVLKPNGKVFISQYNSTGLMLDHLLKGIESNSINQGASQWALNALVNGEHADNNPNFISPEGIHELCCRFGLKVICSTPEGQLDLSKPNGIDETKVIQKHYSHYVRTVEFVAEKENSQTTTISNSFKEFIKSLAPHKIIEKLR